MIALAFGAELLLRCDQIRIFVLVPAEAIITKIQLRFNTPWFERKLNVLELKFKTYFVKFTAFVNE